LLGGIERCGCKRRDWSNDKQGKTMINQMTINGVKAVITYDSDMDLFRAEFIGLNGGADFYAADAEGLPHEGVISLKVFMEACQKYGVEVFKAYCALATPQLPDRLSLFPEKFESVNG